MRELISHTYISHVSTQLFIQSKCNRNWSDQFGTSGRNVSGNIKRGHTYNQKFRLFADSLCPQRETRNTHKCFINITWPYRSTKNIADCNHRRRYRSLNRLANNKHNRIWKTGEELIIGIIKRDWERHWITRDHISKMAICWKWEEYIWSPVYHSDG